MNETPTAFVAVIGLHFRMWMQGQGPYHLSSWGWDSASSQYASQLACRTTQLCIICNPMWLPHACRHAITPQRCLFWDARALECRVYMPTRIAPNATSPKASYFSIHGQLLEEVTASQHQRQQAGQSGNHSLAIAHAGLMLDPQWAGSRSMTSRSTRQATTVH